MNSESLDLRSDSLLAAAILGLVRQAQAEDGKPRAVRVLPRNPVGRNNPCPCGSGRKFKKCCFAR